MRAQGGFTLIEIMVVLLIIAGLAYVVGTNVIGQLDKSKIENTKIQIVQLESGLKLFKVDNGFYPDTQQGLDALIVMPTTGREPRRYDSSGYLDGDQIPLDQWGSELIYIGPDQTGGTTYEIISPGQDGVPQTEDDISSRNIR
ncbi:MAG: type II secretion system major pseudopilin GspG [Candidatus Dadabacteria bacterium]|nr:type II secretion system major pseudopilin GspG [Candidatus Dadabacteria bacterium]